MGTAKLCMRWEDQENFWERSSVDRERDRSRMGIKE